MPYDKSMSMENISQQEIKKEEKNYFETLSEAAKANERDSFSDERKEEIGRAHV